METDEQRYAKLQTAATSLVKEGNVCSDPQVPLSKLNYLQRQLRWEVENPDSQLNDTGEQDPVELVAQAAKAGTWVLISTARFPQFWKRLCTRLEQLELDNEIDD